MLVFAVRVTREPDALTEDDVQTLRDAGMEEQQILSVVLIACLCNFMDRLGNSLGVNLDSGYRRILDSWLLGVATEQKGLTQPPGHQPEEALVESQKNFAIDLNDVTKDPPADSVPSVAETLVDSGDALELGTESSQVAAPAKQLHRGTSTSPI